MIKRKVESGERKAEGQHQDHCADSPDPLGSSSSSSAFPSPLSALLLQRQGPLSDELVRVPGDFGLGQLPRDKKPDATTSMVCGYCSTGCALDIHMQDGEAVNLTPTVDYPVNSGMACPKGWEALTVLNSPDRGTMPFLRDDFGQRVPVKWDVAMQVFCDRFKKIQEQHGKQSVAFLGTGQIPIEETAFMGALAKFGMGLIHGDGNTRQCMATAAVAYKQSFGFDAPPFTYQDFEESDVIVLVGSNLCLAHPIMWQRICRNPNKPEIIVLDPRTTETAVAATQHLALKPKSDLELLYGLAHILISEGWIDEPFIREHVNDYDAFAKHVEKYTPEYVEQVSGIPKEKLHYVARTIHKGKRVSFWWMVGVNQSYQGVRTAQAIINLALITGNIGRPGTGANSITGQGNAMGSRLFSNTTNMLGGHDFKNAEHRKKVAGVLQIDESTISTEESWAYDRIIEGILRDEIKGLWVVCTNPAHSWINQNTFREIVERLDFLVVQDMYHSTETALLADLYLPAAGWGEKEGTFINSERRLGLIKKVAKAPGEALSDFSIFRLIAHYWGCGEMFAKWQQPEDVFQSLKELTRGQPCDITGIADYQMIDERGGIQWPYPEGCKENESQRRLFADGQFFHPDGRAKLLFEDSREMPEPPNKRYPLLLMTGRGSASQWHTQTRTSKSAVLRSLYSEEAYIEINPQDARHKGIRPNAYVIVESQRGSMTAKAFVTPTIQPGQVFIPMHYASVNQLTLAHFDPYSRQPSYKNCAVRISPSPQTPLG